VNHEAPARPRTDFTATRWSLVVAAKGRDSREALTRLCERYWFPLFGCVRRRGDAGWRMRVRAAAHSFQLKTG